MGEEIFYAVFYLLMTSAVVFLIVVVPKTILESAADTHDRDNAIYNERIYSKISSRDPLTFRVVPGVIEKQEQFSAKKINESFNIGFTPRRIAFKLTYDGKSVYYDKDWYEFAKPLSPVRYPAFTQNRPLLIEGDLKKLEIDQVFRRTEDII